MRKALSVVLLVLLSGCLRSRMLRTKTASLDFWMSGDQVRALMGEPRVSASICGEKVGTGWKCTLWRYREATDELYIYFQPGASPGTLSVNRWLLNDDGEPREFKLLVKDGG